MPFWKRFSRQKTEKLTTPPKKSVLDLTTDEKAAIEDDRKAGASAAESAQALNLNVETVYAYRKSITAREQQKPLTDPSQERQRIKETLEIAKMQAECDAVLQKMQIDRIHATQELQDLMEDAYGPGGEDMSIQDLIGLFEQAKMLKESNQTQSAAGIPDRAQAAITAAPETSEDPPLTDLTDDQMREIIKRFDKKQISLAKIMPDSVIFDRIAKEMPSVSDKSINRGIEILRKEF